MVAQQRKGAQSQPDPTALGVTAIKPPDRKGWEAVKYLIHDPEKGEFFTRTPKSWFLIILFYCVYYCCLAAFWYGLLQVFFTFLPNDRPKYTLDSSLISNNPGVGLKPNQPDVSIASSMLFLKYDDTNSRPSEDFESASNIDWAKRYEKYLTRYDNMTGIKECSGDEASPVGEPACKFDLSELGECANFPYGYIVEPGKKQVNPCVLLKINRIYDWNPEPMTEDDIQALEGTEDPVPQNVQNLIRQNPNKVYLDCVGENPADMEALANNMDYYPEDQGISFKYFPYNHAHRNYHNPIVAVKFRETLPKGQLVHVECKLWAKGVTHSSKFRLGQVHFEVYLEN